MKTTGCPDFIVERPHKRGGAVVRAADFGFSRESDTNAAAVNAALAEAKRIGAARFVTGQTWIVDGGRGLGMKGTDC